MKKLALIVITCLACIAAILLAWELRNVVGILLVAIVFATTLSGFVSMLVNRGWSSRASQIAIILGVGLVIVFFVVITGYAIGSRLPLALEDFRAMYGDLRASLFAGNSAQRALALRMPHPLLLDDILLGSNGSGLLTIASGISSNAGSLISNVVLVIFVAIYWVADRERIERLWLSLMSPSQRITARKLLHEVEDAIGSHLRSQIVQYVLTLLLLIAGYMTLGMKYAFLLAWAASLIWFVPLIGGFLALIPAFLLGLIQGYSMALTVVLYTLLVFVALSMVIQRIPSLRQRPGSILELMITIALIDVMGLVGLAVAVPVAVAVHVLLSHYLSLSPASKEEREPVQIASLQDKLAAIQQQIHEEGPSVSPQTLSIFDRLNQMVATMNGGDAGA